MSLEESFLFLEKMALLRPRSKRALRLLGRRASELDLRHLTVAIYESLNNLVKEDAAVRLLLGEAYISAGKARHAIALGEAILAKDPANDRALTMVQRASVMCALEKGSK